MFFEDWRRKSRCFSRFPTFCSSHAGLLAHLSLRRRRRRAAPPALVENGNSGSRCFGKWRLEWGGRGSHHPRLRTGMLNLYPHVVHRICLLLKLCPAVGLPPCWSSLCGDNTSMLTSPGVALGPRCRCMKAVCFLILSWIKKLPLTAFFFKKRANCWWRESTMPDHCDRQTVLWVSPPSSLG